MSKRAIEMPLVGILRAVVEHPGMWVFALGVASVGGYHLAARMAGVSGFPLDDAWIHQTYARNLGTLREWSFVPGQPSAGSTSPLWTLLLAGAYWLGVSPFVWTATLGAAAHGAAAWFVYRLSQRLWPARRAPAIAAGVLVALEWHLVWAAASGMETSLFVSLALAALLVSFDEQRAVLSGVLVGLALWTRPDGLTLLPAVFLIISRSRNARRGFVIHGRGRRITDPAGAFCEVPITRLLAILAGFAALAIPYLALNVQLSGEVWPTTFFAKQAEYAVLRHAPLWSRYARLLLRPLTGVLALVFPAALALVRRLSWTRLVVLGWGLAYVGLYAVRLPATYQYGRYVMPAIPMFAVVGVGGAATLLRLDSSSTLPRVVSRAWLLVAALLLAIFWGIGVRRFVTDVRIIQTEMVASARWIADHTPADALVAAHDIGALGYYGERDLLDLAGIVSPEVIPFIRDETRLAEFLDARRADYLMTFPGWYPHLTARPDWQLLYSTGSPYALAEGGENMVIYLFAGDSTRVLYSTQSRGKSAPGVGSCSWRTRSG